MSNPNDPLNYGREVRQETYSDTDGSTNVTKTTETVNGANIYQEDALVARDNENAGRGLLIGILLASLAALTAGAVWFANQRDDINPATPVVVPVPNRAEPSPVPETKTETTIIEKTRDVLVPVPQQASPAPQPSTAAPEQNVNITVPPVTSPSPATETAPPKSDTSSSSNTQSTTTMETAPKSDTSSSPDTQSTTTTENSTTTTESNTETPATSDAN